MISCLYKDVKLDALNIVLLLQWIGSFGELIYGTKKILKLSGGTHI